MNIKSKILIGIISTQLLMTAVCGAEALGDITSGNEDVTPYVQDSFEAATSGTEVVFKYNPREIYRVYCQDGFLTDIKFQAGEKITYIGGGDTTRWVIDKSSSGAANSQEEHLYIKPVKRGLSTNIVVTTSRRTYQLNVISGSQYNPMVSWIFPDEEHNMLLRNLEERQEENFMVVNAMKLHFDYKISNKSYSWSPQQVFDDGQKTYLQMKPEIKTGDAPAFFVKNKRGESVLVNYRVVRGYYVIDRLFDKAELVVGTEKVSIKR